MSNTNKVLLAVVCLLATLMGWAYWPTFCDVAERWWTNPLYSHGYLVPAFAVFLLWHRREMLPANGLEPRWWGTLLLAVGIGGHLFGAYFYMDWISAASILPTLAGLCVCVGGSGLLRWSWPAIAFLAFMLPLPYQVETSLAYPLQRLATLASTYTLQTLGFAAVAEGNIIIMENSRIGVIEACNGLGMMVTFFALAAAVAILMRGRPLDKLIIILSAVPIALLANTIRITVTGMLAETIGGEIVDAFLHGAAGWFMTPVALALLYAETLVLGKLFVDASEPEEVFGFVKPDRVKESCAV
jgi:exosortase